MSAPLPLALVAAGLLAFSSLSPALAQSEGGLHSGPAFEECIVVRSVDRWQISATGLDVVAAHFLDEVTLAEGFSLEGDIEFAEYKGLVNLIFTDGRLRLVDFFDPMIFEGGNLIDYVERPLVWRLVLGEEVLAEKDVFEIETFAEIDEAASERIVAALSAGDELAIVMDSQSDDTRIFTGRFTVAHFDDVLAVVADIDAEAKELREARGCTVPSWETIHHETAHEDDGEAVEIVPAPAD